MQIKGKMNELLFKRLAQIKKTTIFYINVNSSDKSGFFALLRYVLDGMCYADEAGFVPYVIYGGVTLYLEEKPIKGTTNVFEYYFRQPCGEKELLMPWRVNLINANSLHMDTIEYKYNHREFSYYVSNLYIEKMSKIYAKYIRLTADTEKYIKRSAEKKLDKKRTLGIHIRGTDFNKMFDNHPIPVTVDDYVAAIHEAVEMHHYKQVFVATDDVRCLHHLRQQLSIPIVYYDDIARSDIDKSVPFIRHQRKNDRYLLGLEVLRDTYTLTYCTGFIGCLSQVDIFVQIVKKSRGGDFAYKKIMDKGISNTGKTCWEPRE